jgi:hypothetical protein
MIRTSKIGFLIALLVMFAITIVLVTPDPNDDIEAILRPQKMIKPLLLTAALSVAGILQLVDGQYVESTRIAISRGLRRRLCTYRC